MLIIWILVFIVSLVVLVKGTDWLLESSEKMGLAFGLSPFVVGVTIVGIGTSFPELISSLAAVLKGANEIVAANVIGSNIANILLIIGVSAIIAKKLEVTKNLIDIDLPLLALSTMLFLGVAYDREINLTEALILLATYAVYFIYIIFHKSEQDKVEVIERPKITMKDFVMLVVGILALVFGAEYLIESVIKLSEILNIATGVIAITAVALGTSVPELLVSVKAAYMGKSEVALGNIFGSNVFNILAVTGIPALFQNLSMDNPTFVLGMPMLIMATFAFVISGISRRVYIWEGFFFLSIYIVFVGKLYDIF